MLSSLIASGAAAHPEVSPELIQKININDADFMTNAQVEAAIGDRVSSPSELAAAIEVNSDARLRALQISLLGLSGLALLAIVPAGRMPGRMKGDLPEQLEPDDPDAIPEEPAAHRTTPSDGTPTEQAKR
jgi:hypothetical protein